jgi:hypothetical protein
MVLGGHVRHVVCLLPPRPSRGHRICIWGAGQRYNYPAFADEWPLSRLQCSWTISLRLLALILCSNCSNTFNKVLTSTWRHIVKLLFETSGHHFSLLKMFHGWSKHFTSRYDPSTPYFNPPPQRSRPPHKPNTNDVSFRCSGGLFYPWDFVLVIHIL